ncbi:MAG: hypothetical protein SVY53_11835 [Chloroflexota bacterium]|nr:hypothetical protein [Chloroflexota bacterium]
MIVRIIPKRQYDLIYATILLSRNKVCDKQCRLNFLRGKTALLLKQVGSYLQDESAVGVQRGIAREDYGHTEDSSKPK